MQTQVCVTRSFMISAGKDPSKEEVMQECQDNEHYLRYLAACEERYNRYLKLCEVFKTSD